jgi:hypothetical protein
MPSINHKRRWGLLTRALDLIQSEMGCSEAIAFEALKALIVDGRVHARGLWPLHHSDGLPRRREQAAVLQNKEFSSAVRTDDNDGICLVGASVTLPWVEINMNELRTTMGLSDVMLPFIPGAGATLSDIGAENPRISADEPQTAPRATVRARTR